MQLPSLLYFLHSLYWTDITHPYIHFIFYKIFLFTRRILNERVECKRKRKRRRKVPSHTMAELDVQAYQKAVEEVIYSQYARLGQTLESSMTTFSRFMFEAKVIDKEVMRSFNYDNIMMQFMSAMEFKHSIPELQEHCQLLINVLEKLGGAEKLAANEISRLLSQLEQNSSPVQSIATSLSEFLNIVIKLSKVCFIYRI